MEIEGEILARVSFILFFVGFICAVLSFSLFGGAKRSVLIDADYYQKLSVWVIFCKDSKFGLYNRNKRKVVLSPVYDSLCWKNMEKGILEVEKEGEIFLIYNDGRRLK